VETTSTQAQNGRYGTTHRRQHPQLDRVLNDLLAASVRRLTELVAEALHLPVAGCSAWPGAGSWSRTSRRWRRFRGERMIG
jgi:hypothetical protein